MSKKRTSYRRPGGELHAEKKRVERAEQTGEEAKASREALARLMPPKKPRAAPASGSKRARKKQFVARFHENPRAHLKCACTFPDGCDGSRLIACSGCDPTPGIIAPACMCEACELQGVTGCQGCRNCLAAECASCGKRAPDVQSVEGESWTCSPECTKKVLGG